MSTARYSHVANWYLEVHRQTELVWDFVIATFPDNASFSPPAVDKKTEPACGMPPMLSSHPPGKDASRAGDEGLKWSPASSPTKPAAGKSLDPVQLLLILLKR